MKRLGYRYQRTLARPVELMGIGFLTGASIHIRFRPAPPSTGVVFLRTDLQPPGQLPACIDHVIGTDRRTTLGSGPVRVALVEHVLAALHGLRIDNCYIELNAPEPPGLDGSAQQFVNALLEAGIVLQSARRPIFGVTAPVITSQNGATLSLHPHPDNELKISYLLDYGLNSPIARQICTEVISPETFACRVAGCRTFLLRARRTSSAARDWGRGQRLPTCSFSAGTVPSTTRCVTPMNRPATRSWIWSAIFHFLAMTCGAPWSPTARDILSMRNLCRS